MITNEWPTANTVISSADSIVSHALPGALAAPPGWHSEVLSSDVATTTTTNVINADSTVNTFSNYDEYKTLNTSDAPPIIYSSTNETNRVVHQIPTTEYSQTDSVYNEKVYSSQQQQQQENTILKEDVFQQPPIVIHKTLPNNDVTYEQHVSVKYLQPPSPPPPGPIIIREVRPPPPPPQSPVKIRQRPPPPVTPPPVVIRERPPQPPPRIPSQVVEKVLPAPPRPPRRMIVEHYGACPPKPPNVIIERWLPYKSSERRKILYERAPTCYRPPQEPNTLVLHASPHARIRKEFINEGVIRADPVSYLHRYGGELDSWHTKSQFAHLINEADREIPPPHSSSISHHYGDSYNSYFNRYSSSPISHHYGDSYNSYFNRYSSSPIPHVWDQMKSISPLPYSYTHHSRYSPVDYGYYSSSYGDIGRTMVDVTSKWGRNCSSSLPSYDDYHYSSSYSRSSHPRTIQVNSEGELRHVLADITNERVPSLSRYY